MLAPPEGLRAPGVPGVNPGGRPQESGGDSKAMLSKKNFCDRRMDAGRTDRRVGRNSDLDYRFGQPNLDLVRLKLRA